MRVLPDVVVELLAPPQQVHPRHIHATAASTIFILLQIDNTGDGPYLNPSYITLVPLMVKI